VINRVNLDNRVNLKEGKNVQKAFYQLADFVDVDFGRNCNIAGYLIDLYRYDGLEPDLVVLDGNLFKEAVCEMLRIASCFPRMLTA